MDTRKLTIQRALFVLLAIMLLGTFANVDAVQVGDCEGGCKVCEAGWGGTYCGLGDGENGTCSCEVTCYGAHCICSPAGEACFGVIVIG